MNVRWSLLLAAVHCGQLNMHGQEVTLWNSLPEQLQQPDITFRQFKRLLKMLVC